MISWNRRRGTQRDGQAILAADNHDFAAFLLAAVQHFLLNANISIG